MKIPALACLIISALLAGVLRAAEPAAAPRFDQSKLAAVPEQMKEFIERQEIAGAVTVVATREGVVQLQAVGQSNVEKSESMKPDAIFWIASMTKPVTGLVIDAIQKSASGFIDSFRSMFDCPTAWS